MTTASFSARPANRRVAKMTIAEHPIPPPDPDPPPQPEPPPDEPPPDDGGEPIPLEAKLTA